MPTLFPIIVTTSGPIYTPDTDITAYTGLVAKINAYLARSDLTQYIPGWLAEAEDILNYGSERFPPLRCREMEAATTITMTDGVGELPVDFLAVKYFKDSTANRYPLNYIGQDIAIMRYPDGAGGVSSDFTIIGEDVYAYPISTGDFTLVFYQKIPRISEDNPSNWLSEKNHSIYLHLVLAIAFDFLRNNEEMMKHAGLAIDRIRGMHQSQMTDAYRRSGLTMRGVTP